MRLRRWEDLDPSERALITIEKMKIAEARREIARIASMDVPEEEARKAQQERADWLEKCRREYGGDYWAHLKAEVEETIDAGLLNKSVAAWEADLLSPDTVMPALAIGHVAPGYQMPISGETMQGAWRDFLSQMGGEQSDQ